MVELLVRHRVVGYEHVAQAWADWQLNRSEREARYLQHKKHPRRTAAEVMREKGREMAELRRRMKFAEYLTALYEFHFPWLEEFRDAEAELNYAAKGQGHPVEKRAPVVAGRGGT